MHARVKLFEVIRRDHRSGISIRELADRHHLHLRTVRQALESAVPTPRRVYLSAAMKLPVGVTELPGGGHGLCTPAGLH